VTGSAARNPDAETKFSASALVVLSQPDCTSDTPGARPSIVTIGWSALKPRANTAPVPSPGPSGPLLNPKPPYLLPSYPGANHPDVKATRTGAAGSADNGSPSAAETAAPRTVDEPKHKNWQEPFNQPPPANVSACTADAGAANVAFAPSASAPVPEPALTAFAFMLTVDPVNRAPD